MKIKVLLLSLFISTLFISCSRNRDKITGHDDMLTKEAIVEVAKEMGKDLELPMELITTYYDVNNIEWDKCFSVLKKDDIENYDFVKEKLRNRSYQAVLLRPEPGKLCDGSFWVLIDKRTGEGIIAVQDNFYE